MRLERDLVDDWELQDVWPLTRASEESGEGYTRTRVQPGGGIVRGHIDRLYVPLRLVGAIA